MKKTAHIISHSHWDREWYLPYEKHHMLLIEFMDTLIETLEKDPDYKSFHLDGQTLLIDDYLQVRPNMKDRIKALVQKKRIHVGPWFILQDAFLTSSEANVRNMQYGHEMAREYGDVCKIGYFPDTFGNMGQAPQILKKSGIDTAVFGRGVKPTGFNNQVSDTEGYESPYSEMYWQSGDGSKVLGILFANWYSNGNEVPTDKEEAKIYWEKKLADTEKYASTSHLLYMNGCDHQPIQTDLSEAIRTAKEVYPDVEFVHSNFEDYVRDVNKELRSDMKVIKGELRSQETNGWYTLANTASARIYLKQANAYCQMLFEKLAEPLCAIAKKEGMEYPHHLFRYGIRLLMENHPHDSICGCSIDDVHREMVTRFEKAENVAKHIIDEALNYLTSKINTKKFQNIDIEAIPFVVTNATGWAKDGVTDIILEVKRKYFREAPVSKVVEDMHNIGLPNYKIINEKGEEVSGTIEVLPNMFNYHLPKDKFREPYVAKRVKVTLEVSNVSAFGWDTYAIIPTKAVTKNEKTMMLDNKNIETPRIKASFNNDGSLNITDKQTGEKFSNLGVYEDCGDIGNEYIFFMPVNDTPITTKGTKAEFEVIKDTEYIAVIRVKQTIMIPKSANKVLDKEIDDIIEFKERKASRGTELIPLVIETDYTFERKSRGIKVVTRFDNHAIDHRLRVLFETNKNMPVHHADSIFEVATRDTVPSKVWENPCNAQHQQSFINVHDEKGGLTIANKGLCEYEVLQDNKGTIAVTIHRGTRELGDWGVFPTPEAQCLGYREVEFAIFPHGDKTDMMNSYTTSYQYQVEDANRQLSIQDGCLDTSYKMFSAEHTEVAFSSLKVNKDGDIISRWYNLDDSEAILTLGNEIKSCYETDLLEEKNIAQKDNKITLGAKEILTLNMKF